MRARVFSSLWPRPMDIPNLASGGLCNIPVGAALAEADGGDPVAGDLEFEVGVGAAVSRTGYPEAVSGDAGAGQGGQLFQAGLGVFRMGRCTPFAGGHSPSRWRLPGGQPWDLQVSLDRWKSWMIIPESPCLLQHGLSLFYRSGHRAPGRRGILEHEHSGSMAGLTRAAVHR